MYKDLKTRYWWNGMKRDVTEYLALCDTCQRVKAEHQRPAGLLQPLKIPEWKWEDIGMDFIVGLPRTQARYDSIWVIVAASQRLPISFLLRGLIRVLSLQSFTCQESCAYMVYRRRSCQIEVPSSHPNFGRNFMSPWILS
jgi:hypothetical protein